MTKRLLLLFLLLLPGGLKCFAQTSDTIFQEPEPLPKYRIRSSVAGVPTVRDRFLSPLVFTGVSFGRNIGTIRHYPNAIRQHNFFSANGVMLNGVNRALLTLVSLGFDYSYLHRVLESPDQKLTVYGGGGFNSLLNLKFHSGNTNNVLAHDLAASLDASGLLSYRFKLFNRQFMLTEQVSVPVMGIISRPSYIWSLPFFLWEEEGRFQDAIQVASWGNFPRVQNKVSLDYQTTRRRRGKALQTNTWRLTYVWDYYQMNRPNQVKSAHHMVMLGRMVRI
jgi:hypothetical protein